MSCTSFSGSQSLYRSPELESLCMELGIEPPASPDSGASEKELSKVIKKTREYNQEKELIRELNDWLNYYKGDHGYKSRIVTLHKRIVGLCRGIPRKAFPKPSDWHDREDMQVAMFEGLYGIREYCKDELLDNDGFLKETVTVARMVSTQSGTETTARAMSGEDRILDLWRSGDKSRGLQGYAPRIEKIRNPYLGSRARSPIVVGIEPHFGNNTGVQKVTLLGGNFRDGARVKLAMPGQPDIISTDVSVGTRKKHSGNTRIECSFNLNGREVGKWDTVVINRNGRSDILQNGFTIKRPEDPEPQPPIVTQKGTDRRGAIRAVSIDVLDENELTDPKGANVERAAKAGELYDLYKKALEEKCKLIQLAIEKQVFEQPQRDAKVLFLHEIEGNTYREIASELGIDTEKWRTVQSISQRALKRLKTALRGKWEKNEDRIEEIKKELIELDEFE